MLFLMESPHRPHDWMLQLPPPDKQMSRAGPHLGSPSSRDIIPVFLPPMCLGRTSPASLRELVRSFAANGLNQREPVSCLYSFIHSFMGQLFPSTPCLSATILGTGDPMVKANRRGPAFWMTLSSGRVRSS